MRLPADTKVIGQGIKERLGGVEQEPLPPEMEEVLRDLGEEVVGELGRSLDDTATDHKGDTGPAGSD